MTTMDNGGDLGELPNPVAEPPVDDERPDEIDSPSPGVRDEVLMTEAQESGA
jgi:hypothetical protein